MKGSTWSVYLECHGNLVIMEKRIETTIYIYIYTYILSRVYSLGLRVRGT